MPYIPPDENCQIVDVMYHHFPGTGCVTACLVMDNGYIATGHAICSASDIHKFDLACGKAKAKERALKHLRADTTHRGIA